MPNSAEIVERTVQDFQKVQAHMKTQRKKTLLRHMKV